MNVYLNITVSDTEDGQDKDAPVVLTTINCDGVKRFWNADGIDEFHQWWYDEDYGGPAGDDEVVECVVDGEPVPARTFNDIAVMYGF